MSLMMLRLVLSVKQSESNVIYKKSGGVDEMRTLDKILFFSFWQNSTRPQERFSPKNTSPGNKPSRRRTVQSGLCQAAESFSASLAVSLKMGRKRESYVCSRSVSLGNIVAHVIFTWFPSVINKSLRTQQYVIHTHCWWRFETVLERSIPSWIFRNLSPFRSVLCGWCLYWGPLDEDVCFFPSKPGFQRPSTAISRRQFPHGGGYHLDAMDFEDDSQGWRFDMDMVIIYIYSVNWIIGFFIFCLLCYLFFPSFWCAARANSAKSQKVQVLMMFMINTYINVCTGEGSISSGA